MKNKLLPTLCHHGIKGQHWGERHGPPYPLDKVVSRSIRMNRTYENDSVRYNASNTPEIAAQPRSESLVNLQRKTERLSLEEDALLVNNRIARGKKGRVFNCQNCSAAVEMRARGYDVAARMRDDGSNVYNPEKWFKGGEFKMVDVDDLVSSYVEKTNGKKFDRQIYDTLCDDAYDRCMAGIRQQPIGSRGIITVGWCRNAVDLTKRTSEFHAFNYLVEKNGILFIDAEGNDRHIFSSSRFSLDKTPRFVDPREWAYMRTDNLELDPSITDAVISRRLVDK